MEQNIPVDFTIIGGGIIGLSLAYELKNSYPTSEIALFDKEAYLGEHSSGRNSGVIHAGLYYPHQSLKHLLCVEGKKRWEKIASDLDIGFKVCEKFIFSTSANEEIKLNELLEKAQKNDVPINWVNKSELTEIRSNVNAHNAIKSPSTGIINVSEALSKLRYNLESRGVHIFFSHEAMTIEEKNIGYKIKFKDFEISTEKLFNCAGLGAIKIREQLGLNDLENYIVRGHYLSTTQRLEYPTLYYPIPPEDLKGLGVHSTIDLDNKVKFGPNTEEVDAIDYTPPKVELTDMKQLVSFYFKNIQNEKLYWDYAGCRSKIRYAKDKKTFSDFWIRSPLPNYIECLGIESPGLTSSPAIANYILKKVI